MITEPRPIYVVRLRPERGVDAIRELRRLLKYAGRRLGLRAIDVREEEQTKIMGDDNA